MVEFTLEKARKGNSRGIALLFL